MQMEVAQTDPEITHIILTGRLSLAGVEDIQAAFDEQIAKGKSTLVDVTDVEYMASMGMRLLLAAYKTLKAQQKKLLLLRPKLDVEQVLQNSGLQMMIAESIGLAAAVEELKQTESTAQ